MRFQFYMRHILFTVTTCVLVYFLWDISVSFFNEIVHVSGKENTSTKQKTEQYLEHVALNERNKSSSSDTTRIAKLHEIKQTLNLFKGKETTEQTDEFKTNDLTQVNIHATEHLEIIPKPEEKRHVVLLKVHKTGSSTLQSIFLRFGDSRNLTFVLAHDNTLLSESKYPNMISYSNSLNDKNIVPPPPGRHYEILCCHVIYNRTQFEKYLPADSAYIGIVRDPVTRLESSMRYFNSFPNTKLSDFAVNPLKYDKGDHSMVNNRMAFEFGFPLELFPNSGNDVLNIKTGMELYITKLYREFDFIVINEKMDESLVYMKRILGWQTKDILYMKQLVAHHETRRFAEEDKPKLKKFLYLDYALYDFAVQQFNEKTGKAGDNFLGEVEHFKAVRSLVEQFCESNDGDSLAVDQSNWSKAFSVTRYDCKMYRYFEIKYIQDIRMKLYGTLNN